MIYHLIISTRIGSVAISWRRKGSASGIVRVFIPDRNLSAEEKLRDKFGDTIEGAERSISLAGEKISAFVEGEEVTFNTRILDFGACSDFQRRVLLAEREIPRGWVSTYKRIAGKAGSPDAARAAGNALARNPFPLIIPCHRAVREDGRLGGFQGGAEMKRELLQMEGVEISDSGRVLTTNIYY